MRSVEHPLRKLYTMSPERLWLVLVGVKRQGVMIHVAEVIALRLFHPYMLGSSLVMTNSRFTGFRWISSLCTMPETMKYVHESWKPEARTRI